MLSSKFDVYRNEWLELVFANRNQAYGAYDLRKNYEHTLAKALFAASAVFITVICAPVVYKALKAVPVVVIVKPGTDPVLKVTDVDMPKKLPELPASAPLKQADPVKVKTLRYVAPRVVDESIATEEIPTLSELDHAVISTVTQDGKEGGSNITPLANGTGGNGTGPGVTEGASEEILDWTNIEKYPEFPGGMEGFGKYLRKNLRYPASAADAGIMGRVVLSFVVERDGSLTDIKVVKGIGFGCDEEAVRVIKKSPLWSPGIQNKRNVRVQYTMPIMFQISE